MKKYKKYIINLLTVLVLIINIILVGSAFSCKGSNNFSNLIGISSYPPQQGGTSLHTNAIDFNDISNDGATFISPTDFGFSDDMLYVANSAIPFDFEIFGNTFNAPINLNICINGWFSFDTSFNGLLFDNTTYRPFNLNINSFMAPFYDDLIINGYSGQGVWYLTQGTAPNRQFILQYFTSGYPLIARDNKLVFQAVLFEGTNDIQFIYAKMQDVNGNDSTTIAGNPTGSSATIGVYTGTSATNNSGSTSEFSHNTASIPLPLPTSSNQAFSVYFDYNPSTQNYTITNGYVNITDIASYNILPRLNNNQVNYNKTQN